MTMAKIVLGNIDKLDLHTTLEKVHVIESVDEFIAHEEGKIYVLEDKDEHVQAVINAEHEVYLPAGTLTAAYQCPNVKVYFDLENYTFYQKAKELIQKEKKPQGVLRFKRTTNQALNESLMTEDLYVLSKLLGEPIDVQVRQTNPSVLPVHVIIMINFGGGTMAHLEYTFTQTDEEHIEFEWSGVKNIIDFDSDALKPIQPDHSRNLALVHSVDSILQTAHELNKERMDQLDHFKRLINGGAK